MNQLISTSVTLTNEQITFAKTKGNNASRYIRTLIDREMSNELVIQSLVNSYWNLLNKRNNEPADKQPIIIGSYLRDFLTKLGFQGTIDDIETAIERSKS